MPFNWTHTTAITDPSRYAQAFVPVRIEGDTPSNSALDTFGQARLDTLLSSAAQLAQAASQAYATQAAASAQAAQAASASAGAAASGGTYTTPYTFALASAATIASALTAIMTCGYAAPGDGGHGLYKRVAAQPSHPGRFRSTDRYLPSGATDATNGGWWELVPERGAISVAQFGADKTGATASDVAFVAAHQMRAAYRNSAGVAQIGVYVPAGQYTLAQSESLCPASYITKTDGFTLSGAGSDMTTITFAPTTGSKVALYNQAHLNGKIIGITFVGTGLDQTFYRADVASNAQQRMVFQDCTWSGVWGRGFHLTGSNNNSEYAWFNCAGNGQMFQFLYTPPASAGGTDQALNYRFSACEWWFTAAPGGVGGNFTGAISGGVLTVSAVVAGTVLAAGQTIATPTTDANAFGNMIADQPSRIVILAQMTGTTGGVGTYSVAFSTGTVASTTLAALANDANSLIDMATGGSIHFWACDFSGWQSGTAFQLRGGTHAQGVCAFSSDGCRHELKSAKAAILYTEWPQGSILINGCDWSSQAGSYYGADGVSLVNAIWVAASNTAGATLRLASCNLSGAISIAHGTDDYAVPHDIIVSDCIHSQTPDIYAPAPLGFVRYVSSTNDIGAPAVMFERVRGANDRIADHATWAPATAYNGGDVVSSNGGRSLYKCTTAGTSGSAAAVMTGSISGTTLTLTSVASGTVSVGQKVTATYGVSATCNTASSSTTVTISARTSSAGQPQIGQVVTGAGIPAGATVAAFGTYNGTSGTITISAAATATATGVTLAFAGPSVLEDTIVVAGSGSTWTVNRSQTVFSQTITFIGGPQSASAAIPDGTAAWRWLSNMGADHPRDGTAISPYNSEQISRRPPRLRRVAEFGGALPTNTGGVQGCEELVLPANARIVKVTLQSPSSAVTGSNPADYLLECDDGTVLAKVLTSPASGGFLVTATPYLEVGTDPQKRRIKLIAGGVAGSNVDQANTKGCVSVEYLA